MLTSTEVMAMLRINRATLCRYCRRGILPHLRMPDQSYRFERNSIQTWVAQRTI
jgi:predicted site-specific integrase-resolvase